MRENDSLSLRASAEPAPSRGSLLETANYPAGATMGHPPCRANATPTKPKASLSEGGGIAARR